MSEKKFKNDAKCKVRPLRTALVTVLKSEKNNVGMHSHSYYEFVYVESGSAEHIFKDKRITLNPGNYFIVPPNVPHGYAPVSGKDFRIYNVCFTPDIIDKTFNLGTTLPEMLAHPLFDITVGSVDDSFYENVFFCNNDTVFQTVSVALSEYSQKKPNYRRMLRHIVCALLIEVSRNISPDTDEKGANGFVSDVVNYVNENYQSNIELTAICEELGYNHHYVGRCFKKQMGRTFTEYVHKIRIKKACFFLLSTTMSIAQVANSVGYQNITYFYRIFKEQTGTDPKSFRTKETLS